MSLNRSCISGNLVRDPELRATAGGMAVLKMSVAVNERVKEDGEWTDRASFFDVTMFGTRAESVSRFLQKGSKVAIEGKLRQSTWEKDGQKRSKVEIIADDIEFMSSRDGGGQSAQQSSPAPKPETYEDDIPF